MSRPSLADWIRYGVQPSPFCTSTRLSFTLTERSRVNLVLYDSRGRRARDLVHAVKDPGTHEVIWDGTDALGRALPSGVYFARLDLSGQSIVRKIIVSR